MRPFHFMKTIPTDSPLYLRRLVRELNAGIRMENGSESLRELQST